MIAMRKSLLIAEDDENILDLLLSAFSRTDLRIHPARSGTEAIALIDQHDIDVVLTDLVMPGGDGIEVLSHAKKTLVHCEVILMTGYGTVESAVQAMKLGAFHYITKPFKVMEVVHLVDRALEMTGVKKENIHLKRQAAGRYRFENLIGISEPFRQVLSLLSKVAGSDSTVLILGESGTGKELIARAIHYNSSRADRILVPVNCSAIPGELLESELFGTPRRLHGGPHRKDRPVRRGPQGTIFLDEIGEMSRPSRRRFSGCSRSSRSRRWGERRRSTWTFASSQRRTRIWKRRSPRGDSARISTSVSTCFRPVPPLRERSRTSRCWWNISSENTPGPTDGKPTGSVRMRWKS